jgi:hypothetical protein
LQLAALVGLKHDNPYGANTTKLHPKSKLKKAKLEKKHEARNKAKKEKERRIKGQKGRK